MTLMELWDKAKAMHMLSVGSGHMENGYVGLCILQNSGAFELRTPENRCSSWLRRLQSYDIDIEL